MNFTTSYTNATSIVVTTIPMTRSCVWCQPPLVVLAFTGIFAVIISLGIFGNLFVIVSVTRSRKLRRASINWMLLHLAVADLGNLIALTPDIIMSLLDSGWMFPAVLCPLCRYLQEWFLYASLLIQIFICTERFIVICVPLQKERLLNQENVIKILCILWVIACVVASPYAAFQRLTLVYRKWWICDWKVAASWVFEGWTIAVPFPYLLVFKWFECLTLYFIPLAMMTLLYAQTVFKLKNKDTLAHLYANQSMTHAVIRLRKSVIKMLIITIAIYYFCYSPIQTIFVFEYMTSWHLHLPMWVLWSLIAIFVFEYMTSWHLYLPMWMRWSLNGLAMSSSAANPFIYIIYHRQYRDRFIDFCDRIHCKSLSKPLRKDSAPIALTLMNPTKAKSALRAHMAVTARMANVTERPPEDGARSDHASTFSEVCKRASSKRKVVYNDLFEYV